MGSGGGSHGSRADLSRLAGLDVVSACPSRIRRSFRHYVDMAPEKRSPAGLSGRRLALVIAGTALAAGTVAAVAMLAINRPHAWGAGAWISDFAKSPGMAGLFAMVAALVALGGIAHQVSQARNALEHQREVEQDRAWWTRFEWAAARAVPPDRSETPLPWPAVLSTFDALASSARDDVQKRAVGAIVEVAASRPHAATVARTEAGEPGQPSTDGETARLAMLAYLRTTENTPAASPAVRGLLYESEVRQALQRVAGLPFEHVIGDLLSNETAVASFLKSKRIP